MSGVGRWLRTGLQVAAVVARAAYAEAATPPPVTIVKSIELSGAFQTRSAWRFVASQGPYTADPFGSTDDKLPGVVDLCLQKDPSAPCDPSLQSTLETSNARDPFDEPHYLNAARVVRPRGPSGRPLLLVQTASTYSGDGDQLVLTQVLAYDRASDRFVRVYGRTTGHNNNQEVRYMEAGPLAGDIISAEPTENAPFAFWVTVNALTPAYTYRAVLRYRSATTYEDGNPLPVIDSEMPGLEQRLALWRPGALLPLPASPCLRPHLVHKELWCG